MATLSIALQQKAFSFWKSSTTHKQATSTFQDIHLPTKIRCSLQMLNAQYNGKLGDCMFDSGKKLSTASRVGSKCVESLPQLKGLRNVACGILDVWAVNAVSPVIAANQRLPPLLTEPNRCEHVYVGNTIGRSNGKSNLKGKSLAAALVLDAKFDGADMSEVVMSKPYAVGASFKGILGYSWIVKGKSRYLSADIQ
ncbi:hypothetical protein Pfo_014644 [Paulownia fortunei]|nr:hypothetical protein Pfo_014644 [Paulownia fortunei]